RRSSDLYGPTEILLGFGAISKYLRVSADLVVQPAAPDPRGKPGSRPSKNTAGERQTVCWREMDSNHRYRLKNNPFWLPAFGPAIRLPQQKPALSCRDRWFESISLQRGVRCELDTITPVVSDGSSDRI